MASFLKRTANASFVPRLLSIGPSMSASVYEVFAVAIEMPRADNALFVQSFYLADAGQKSGSESYRDGVSE